MDPVSSGVGAPHPHPRRGFLAVHPTLKETPITHANSGHRPAMSAAESVPRQRKRRARLARGSASPVSSAFHRSNLSWRDSLNEIANKQCDDPTGNTKWDIRGDTKRGHIREFPSHPTKPAPSPQSLLPRNIRLANNEPRPRMIDHRSRNPRQRKLVGDLHPNSL